MPLWKNEVLGIRYYRCRWIIRCNKWMRLNLISIIVPPISSVLSPRWSREIMSLVSNNQSQPLFLPGKDDMNRSNDFQ